MVSVAEQKQELRTRYGNLRKMMVRENVVVQTFEQLSKHSWFSNAKNIAIYISQSFEFPTQDLFEFCKRENKTVCAPIMDDQKQLAFHQIESWENLHQNHLGISEPVFGPKVEPERIHVFFVPLVAFDRSGRRLGRKGGSYDRLFANSLVTGTKVGLGFEFQDCLSVPAEAHDISMDYILTEKKIFRSL